MLDNLHDALSRSAWPEALGHALAAWRATRSPELADLIDRITARCTLPVPDGTPAEKHLWWIEHGRVPNGPDPVMTGGLLAFLAYRADVLDAAIDAVRKRWSTAPQTRLAIHFVGNVRWPTNFQERCAILLAWTDHDPRISRAIVEALRAPSVPHVYGILELFDMLAERVVEIGDVRVLPLLELMISEPRGPHPDRRLNQVRFAKHAKGGLEVLPVPRSPGPLLPTCVAFLPLPAPAAASRPDLEALWREVAANPDDVGTRSVLGDALAEAGDPRGDVIVLQCNSKKPGRPLRGRNRDVYDGRVKTLLRLQWQHWLGDLALVLPRRACEFRCGMLEVVTVGTSGSPEWVYAKARGHRELVCVHTVRPGWIKASDLATFIAALPRFPHTIAASDPSVFEELAAASTPMDRLRRLELVRSPITIANDRPLPGWSTNGLRDVLGRVGSLAPELRELVVRDHVTARLFPVFARDIRKLFPKLEKLAVDEPTSILARDLVADRTFEVVPAVR